MSDHTFGAVLDDIEQQEDYVDDGGLMIDVLDDPYGSPDAAWQEALSTQWVPQDGQRSLPSLDIFVGIIARMQGVAAFAVPQASGEMIDEAGFDDDVEPLSGEEETGS